MLWASGISRDEDLAMAVGEAAAQVRERLAGARPDLVLVFVSPQHASAYASAPRLVSAAFADAIVIGCSGGGIIGAGREVEDGAAVSLSAAVLPDVEIRTFAAEADELPAPQAAASDWRAALRMPGGEPLHWLVLPEPFSFDSEAFLRGLDGAFPHGTKSGGLASGATAPGGNALFLGTETRRSGVVGVALRGALTVDGIVAQGCRPIGEPMFVTACERNILRELDGEPAFAKLQTTFEQLSELDRALARHSLFLGIVMRDDRQEYRQGDFLVRNLMAADPESGALAIGALLRRGAVVQFHLRDAQTSAADLELMLEQYRAGGAPPPRGALLFSCLGRGQHLYGAANHDSGALRRHLGDVPLGGFFCNGEVGQVHGTTFLHGYTSSFALFRER